MYIRILYIIPQESGSGLRGWWEFWLGFVRKVRDEIVHTCSHFCLLKTIPLWNGGTDMAAGMSTLVCCQAREIYIKVLWRGGKSSPCVCMCGVRPARTLTWTFLSKYIYDQQMFTDAENCLCVFQDSRWIKFVPLHEEYHLFLFWMSCSRFCEFNWPRTPESRIFQGPFSGFTNKSSLLRITCW